MSASKALLALLATAGRTSDVAPVTPEAVRIGHVVRPWPGRDLDTFWRPGAVIMDLGLCFLQRGTVVAVDAYIHGANWSGAWPVFYSAQEVDESTWVVQSEAAASVDGAVGLSGAVRLQLVPPLPVKTGHCLCWRYPPDVRGVIAFSAWFGEPWQGPPRGADATAVAVLMRAPRALQLNESLRFERVRRRRYAVQAVFIPATTSFQATVQHRLGSPRPKRGAPLLAPTKEERDAWAVRCWGEEWGSSSHPSFCCLPAGQGRQSCFSGEATYERCCSPHITGPLGFDPSLASLAEPLRSFGLVDAGGAPRATPPLKVDLYVRTYYEKLQELTLLLQSAALFWPAEWGAIVALDGESAPDAAACALLPPWVRCIVVDRPPFDRWLNLTFPSLGAPGRGMVWKEWSECWADRHSSADYIAIMDSDVVFTTFGIPQLLFDHGADGVVRPVLWGHAHENYFPSTVEQLGMPPVLDFMDSFPLTLRREDFAYIRSRITTLFRQRGRRAVARGTAFDWAFLAYVKSVHRASLAHGNFGECLSFHAMTGSLLWSGMRDKYVWSIRHGHLAGVPLEFTCPRLRVSHHVPYWNHEHTAYYDVAILKSNLRTHNPFASLGYTARAVALILAGLCDVPWRQRRPRSGGEARRLAFALGLAETSAFSAKALEDVQRDFCAHGAQLVGGVADPLDRLLTWRFPAAAVEDAEVAYCGDLRPSALLREYSRLMAALAFAPPSRADAPGEEP